MAIKKQMGGTAGTGASKATPKKTAVKSVKYRDYKSGGTVKKK